VTTVTPAENRPIACPNASASNSAVLVASIALPLHQR